MPLFFGEPIVEGPPFYTHARLWYLLDRMADHRKRWPDDQLVASLAGDLGPYRPDDFSVSSDIDSLNQQLGNYVASFAYKSGFPIAKIRSLVIKYSCEPHRPLDEDEEAILERLPRGCLGAIDLLHIRMLHRALLLLL